MANYNLDKAAKLKALQDLAQRVDARLDTLEAVGAQANVLEGVKVNGTALAIAEKLVDILIATGTTNGTIAVNGVDVAVKGLAALAYKANVSRDDLTEALQAELDAKAKQTDMDTLTGTGEGSIQAMIDDAFNDFSTKVSDDSVVNSYKELIDWAAEHGAEATEMAAGISENKTAIENLKTFVGTLPESATSTTVVDYIAEAIAALSIGDYAKAADLTSAVERIVTLEGKAHTHSNQDVLDGITADKVTAWDGKAEKTTATTTADGLMSSTDKSKLDGISEEATKVAGNASVTNGTILIDDVETVVVEFATDTEVTAMLDEIFGATA